jgi:sugar lactone lactonase YvrE
MKRVLIVAVAAALTAGYAFGGYTYEGQWGTKGSGRGQFVFPCGIDVAANGNVFVADSENDRIQYFAANGSFLGTWGRFGSRNGQFKTPDDVTLAPDGKVYVADTYNHRVQYFTPTGSFLGKWGTQGSGAGQFKYPEGIAVASNGNVYVVDASTSPPPDRSSGSGALGVTAPANSTSPSTQPSRLTINSTSPTATITAFNISRRKVPSWGGGVGSVGVTVASNALWRLP